MKQLVDAVKAGLAVTARGETVPLTAGDFSNASMWAWLISASGIDMPSEEDFHNILDYDDIVINVQVASVEGLPTKASLSTSSIREALAMPVTAADPAPAPAAAPAAEVPDPNKIKFDKPTGKAPANFPYEEKKLVEPETKNGVWQLLEKIETMWATKKTTEKSVKEVKDKMKATVSEIEEKAGYNQLMPEIMKTGEELASRLQQMSEGGEEIWDKLYMYKKTLMSVYEVLNQGSVTSVEKQKMLEEELGKLLGSDVIANVFAAVEKRAALLAEGRNFKDKFLAVWPVPKGVEKMVKEVNVKKPASLKTAGIIDSIKAMFGKIKQWWNELSDATSDAIVALDEGMPIIENLQEIIS